MEKPQDIEVLLLQLEIKVRQPMFAGLILPNLPLHPFNRAFQFLNNTPPKHQNIIQTQNWRGFSPRLSRLSDLAPLAPPFLLHSLALLLPARLRESLFQLN